MSETEVSMSPERTDSQFSKPDQAGAGKPGAQLAAARVALGLSVEQVADQLKLAPRQIVALEADQYNQLPGMAIVRGFVRAYAKYLRLDAAPLVAMIEVDNGLVAEAAPIRREMATPFSETRMPSMNRRSMTPFWLAGSALLLCVIAVMVGMQLYSGKWSGPFAKLGPASTPETASSAAASMAMASVAEADKNPVATTTGADAANSSPQQALNVPAHVAMTSPVAASPAAATTEPATPPNLPPVVRNAMNDPLTRPVIASNAPTSLPATLPGPATVAAGNPASGNAPEVAKNPNNTLVLKLRQDSWIEVKRGNGTVLVSRLLKAGTVETVEMTEPVQLVVGNVSGVDANLRGNTLNLKTGTGNTARVSLK